MKNDIENNTKKISSEAFVEALKAASEDVNTAGDIRLHRLERALNICLSYKASEYVESLIISVSALNNFRKTLKYKSDGFDTVVRELQDDALNAMILAGFGKYQLRAIGYCFDYWTLKDHDILKLLRS